MQMLASSIQIIELTMLSLVPIVKDPQVSLLSQESWGINKYHSRSFSLSFDVKEVQF